MNKRRRTPRGTAPRDIASREYLATALRAFTRQESDHESKKGRRAESYRRPNMLLVFDTETRTDASQKFLFGSARCYRRTQPPWANSVPEYPPYGEWELIGEWLIYEPATVTPVERAVLETYLQDLPHNGGAKLKLITRREFLDRVFFPIAYTGRALVIGFNLPFDISRLAEHVGDARTGNFAGGFSFALWGRRQNGEWQDHKFRPRVGIKTIDSKRHLIGFIAPAATDTENQIPVGSATGARRRRYYPSGHFLDLRTLAFALTGRSHSLKSLAKSLRTPHHKSEADGHGVITPEYIDYNRNDVQVTFEIGAKLLEEFDRHPISPEFAHESARNARLALQETRVYSPASVGKAYLHLMGIKPMLSRKIVLPQALDLDQLLGYAMTAFYGGRAECHIRRVALPVVYVDFLSMYPTVNALMGLWELLTAATIEVVEEAGAVRSFLQRVELEDCFRPEIWREFPVLAQVEPEGEVLPVRGAYSGEGTAWQIGINPLHAADGRWYALPDIVAAKLLSGHAPRIVRAIRLNAKGRLRGLHPTTLRGTVSVDPRTRDFFKAVIEERRRLDAQLDLPAEEREALNKFLKVLANSSSYGIFAQMDRRDLPSGQKADITVFGLDSPFSCKVAGPEDPGEFFFAPMAACITAAARLMLAMLERCVADRRGEYVMCDTDSMAIVASERGGLVPCVGGRERLADGADAVQALSWADVEEIRALFAGLSPYDRDAVTGSILKLEDENYDAEHVRNVDHEHDPASCPRTQLHIDAISAKRYALFNRADDGRPLLRWEHDAESAEAEDEASDEEQDAAPMLRKNSEHGLGHLLNPLDPNSDRKEWMERASDSIICEDVGVPGPALPWLTAPAMTRITVSTPKLLHTFDTLNRGRPYADQVKPFNFIMSPHVGAASLPEDVSPLRFHLFAPYAEDPAEWLNVVYTDMHSKARRTYMITTEDAPSSTIQVKTYGDVLREYRTHPETTALGGDGRRCGRDTRGPLARRPVRELSLTYIGKEGNRLEDVQAGLIHDPKEVVNEYPDPRRDPFRLYVTPVLREIPIRELIEKTGKSERALQAIRNDHAEPRRALRRTLIAIAGDYARAELRGRAVEVPSADQTACALYVNMADRRRKVT